MARTAIAVTDVPAGSAAKLTFAAVDQPNGNMFPNDGKVQLVVKNGDASPKTVTITGVPCSHGRAGSKAQAIPAGEEWTFGPFDTSLWNQSTGADVNNVYVDYSAGTSVTVAARRQT